MDISSGLDTHALGAGSALGADEQVAHCQTVGCDDASGERWMGIPLESQ